VVADLLFQDDRCGHFQVKAEIQKDYSEQDWIPACAGMTEKTAATAGLANSLSRMAKGTLFLATGIRLLLPCGPIAAAEHSEVRFQLIEMSGPYE
jgi:hypothetical protein